jgi:hypothetical protein
VIDFAGESVIEQSEHRFGLGSRNRLVQASDPGLDGVWAALETFYFAFNNRDAKILASIWSAHPLAQLNNPLGGMLRGGHAIADLYGRIFAGTAQVQVEFSDIVIYGGQMHALFAGRETGTYETSDTERIPLLIRTSRYFRYDPEKSRWNMFHHHGSIDDPQALGAYQRAILARG